MIFLKMFLIFNQPFEQILLFQKSWLYFDFNFNFQLNKKKSYIWHDTKISFGR